MFQNFSGVDDGWWSVMSSSYSPTPLHLPNTLPIDPSESGDCKSSVSARLDERFNPSRSLNRRWMGQVYAKLNGPTFQLHTRSIRSLNYPTDSPFSPIYSFHSQWQRRRLGDRVFSFHVTVYRFLMGCRDDRGQCEKPATPSSLYIYICICTSSVFILDEFRPERSRAKLIKRQLIDSRERCEARLWLKIVNSNDRSTGGLIFYRESRNDRLRKRASWKVPCWNATGEDGTRKCEDREPGLNEINERLFFFLSFVAFVHV